MACIKTNEISLYYQNKKKKKIFSKKLIVYINFQWMWYIICNIIYISLGYHKVFMRCGTIRLKEAKNYFSVLKIFDALQNRIE